MRSLATTALLLTSLASALSVTGADKAPVFTLTDPRGDDNGDGSLLYPRRDDYRPGVFDLLSLEAFAEKDGTTFVATFAEKVTPADRRVIDRGGMTLDRIARNGFYQFNIDVYIDTDRKDGSGRRALLPGRGAEVVSAGGWEKAICLTPQPSETAQELKRILRSFAKDEIRAEKGRVDDVDVARAKEEIDRDLAAKVFFPTRVRVAGPTIRFFVPESFLGGPAQASWGYLVAVSAADVEKKVDLGGLIGVTKDKPERLSILPVGGGSWEDRLGTKRDEVDAPPPLVDILVPRGMKQESLLATPGRGETVKLPVVVPTDR